MADDCYGRSSALRERWRAAPNVVRYYQCMPATERQVLEDMAVEFLVGNTQFPASYYEAFWYGSMNAFFASKRIEAFVTIYRIPKVIVIENDVPVEYWSFITPTVLALAEEITLPQPNLLRCPCVQRNYKR